MWLGNQQILSILAGRLPNTSDATQCATTRNDKRMGWTVTGRESMKNCLLQHHAPPPLPEAPTVSLTNALSRRDHNEERGEAAHSKIASEISMTKGKRYLPFKGANHALLLSRGPAGREREEGWNQPFLVALRVVGWGYIIDHAKAEEQATLTLSKWARRYCTPSTMAERRRHAWKLVLQKLLSLF